MIRVKGLHKATHLAEVLDSHIASSFAQMQMTLCSQTDVWSAVSQCQVLTKDAQ